MSTSPTPHSSVTAAYTWMVDDLSYHDDGVFDRDTVQRAVDVLKREPFERHSPHGR